MASGKVAQTMTAVAWSLAVRSWAIYGKKHWRWIQALTSLKECGALPETVFGCLDVRRIGFRTADSLHCFVEVAGLDEKVNPVGDLGLTNCQKSLTSAVAGCHVHSSTCSLG